MKHGGVFLGHPVAVVSNMLINNNILINEALLLGEISCQKSCPPPVGQFITLNGVAYRDSGARIKARKERQALVARLGVKEKIYM